MKKLFIVFVSLILLGAGCSTNNNRLVTSKQEVAIGKPCNYSQLDLIDNKGLQCYFSKSDTSQPGIWIKPLITGSSEVKKPDYKLEWKKYTSSDNRISFEFPKKWNVRSDLWEGTVDSKGLLLIQMNSANQNSQGDISIEKVKANNFSDIISNESRGGSAILENQIDLNGSTAKILQIASTSNLKNDRIVLIIKTSDYFVVAHAFKHNDSFIDFQTEYLLRSIRVK